jgi:hypothetical protein
MNPRAGNEELGGQMVSQSLRGADDVAVARLEATMTSLVGSVSRLSDAVDENNKRLERLSVLEERNATTSQSLERAFDAIKSVRLDSEALKAKVEAKHAHYDKYLWLAVGFISCVTVGWTVVGYGVNQTIQRTAEKIGSYDLHLAQDKILTRDDVRAVIRDSEGRQPIANTAPIPEIPNGG